MSPHAAITEVTGVGIIFLSIALAKMFMTLCKMPSV